MKQLICLASQPWQAEPTRTQQIMSRLRSVEILFFEPSAPGKGFRRAGRKMRPGLTIYTLPPILEVEERHTYLFRQGQKKLARYIEERMEQHRFRSPVLWACCPSAVHLTDNLACHGLIYDCDRPWERLPIRWESDLALAADVVFAASPGLADHLSPCNDNIALLPNGVNFPMFSRSDLPVPPELQSIRGPILGYLGGLWRDLDVEPLLQSADDHPNATFLLLGRMEKHPLLGALEARRNILLLDNKTLSEQPDYLAHCDVCLNLLRRRDHHSDIVPTRLYEYFSTGKPVVSMLFPGQVEDFPDVVYGAHSPTEFSQLCGRALVEAGDWAKTRRRDYGAAAAWSERANEVTRILETIGLF